MSFCESQEITLFVSMVREFWKLGCAFVNMTSMTEGLS